MKLSMVTVYSIGAAFAAAVSVGGNCLGQQSLSARQEKVILGYDSELLPLSFINIGPDKSLLIGVQGSAEVMLLDSKGMKIRSIGRKGSGPGEFQRPVSGGRLNDSIWVIDGSQRRMAFFTSAGS